MFAIGKFITRAIFLVSLIASQTAFAAAPTAKNPADDLHSWYVHVLELVRMARELAGVFGRKVDVVEKAGLRPMLRAEVLSGSEVFYAA